ncbi:MAG: SIMPL domain-containing protein [Pseudomonadota bacterium]|jgi:uncharacterized protein YggE
MKSTFLLFIASIVGLGVTQAQAQQSISDSRLSQGIVVSGECLTKVIQDRASVIIGSTTVAKSSKEASEKVIKAHEALRARVLELKLNDFISETADYSVNQECSYDQGKQRCEGFRARLATRFETSEIGRVGDVIGISSQLGSEEVSELSTFAAPTTLKAAREGCLEVAMKNAASKAQILARGAGVSLGKLLLVREASSSGSDRPIPLARRSFEAAAMSDMPSPSIDARPLDVRVEVTAQYSLE